MLPHTMDRLEFQNILENELEDRLDEEELSEVIENLLHEFTVLGVIDMPTDLEDDWNEA